MFFSNRKGLFVALFLVVVSACNAAQYPDHAQSTETVTNVRVVWLDPALVDKACRSKDAPDDEVYLGCYDPSTHTIYAPEPRSFNDRWRLSILGHEFWHALGAKHP